MIKAATPGQLNLTEDAGKMLNRFTQLMPDAHSQIKDILGSFLLSLDLNNEILEELRKAGLNKEPQSLVAALKN